MEQRWRRSWKGDVKGDVKGDGKGIVIRIKRGTGRRNWETELGDGTGRRNRETERETEPVEGIGRGTRER